MKRSISDAKPASQSFGTSDSSPPRKSRPTRLHSEQEPSHFASSSLNRGDISPPRRRNQDREDLDSSPPRRHQPHHSDISPPRKGDSSGDISPPRRNKRDEDERDISPPRRHQSTHSDISPPRKGNISGDISPPRRKTHGEIAVSDNGDISPPRRGRDADASTPGMRMMDGGRAGLQTGAQVTAEARQKREEENRRLEEALAETHGDHVTQTVHRDHTGRRVVPTDGEVDVFPRKDGNGRDSHYDERDPMEKHHKSSRRKDRYEEDDEDVGGGKERWGDPLAHLKASGAIESDDDMDVDFNDPMRKFKKRKRENKKPKRTNKWEGYYPPNRYNLRPGAQWDGVDRSNGFEAKLYQAQIDKLHKAERAYRYTSADM